LTRSSGFALYNHPMKFFANGQVGYAIPLTFGRGRVAVSRPGAFFLDDGW
jgi:hypothetical protein